MHVLAARQLVNEAGGMQVTDATLGLCFNMAGGAFANYVSILVPKMMHRRHRFIRHSIPGSAHGRMRF
jgi:hypothetical protein